MSFNVSEQTRRRNRLMEDIIIFISDELIKHYNINKDDAIKSAEEIALNLHGEWRGISIVFPVRPEIVINRQKQQALAEYNGRNITEIVKKYGIAENTFYVWLKEEYAKIKEQRDKDQASLDL